jgi:hypothetical protein
MEMFLIYHSFSAVLNSEEFVPEIKAKYLRNSGVTYASKRISIRLRKDENPRKAVKVMGKKISL